MSECYRLKFTQSQIDAKAKPNLKKGIDFYQRYSTGNKYFVEKWHDFTGTLGRTQYYLDYLDYVWEYDGQWV